ncbi:metal ABC transporter substrate-binding protein [Nocardioides nanhaiensis]|uniref:Zinc ABC transporter substrate-binding protein n=1 Tax=Nocardioides nanhaiensis TaxID=1476871 RepID=A0ABP8WQK7_9ACTN
MRLRLAPAALTALLLATSGCAAFSDEGGTATEGGSGASGSGAPTVVAAFYPLQWTAEQVAGDLAEVEVLTAPGTEPHDLELDVSQVALISEADLVVLEDGFQPAVDDAVAQNGSGETLDVVDVVDLLAADETEAEHSEHAGEEDHAHAEGEEHAEEEGHEEGEEHADEEGHDHDHGEFDPHFWLDPARVADLGDAMAEKLAELDPENAETFRENAATTRATLEELDAAYSEGLAQCERSTIVVSHDAFGYLSKYGLDVEGVAGLTPDAEPTPADLGALQELAREEGITTVFSERLASPAFTEALAGDLGIQTAILDPIEGLTDETASEDYVSLMEQNLDALRGANGCQ